MAAARRGTSHAVKGPAPHGLNPDPKDDYLVALARTEGGDHLVSGDVHLLNVKDPPCVTPAGFLGLLDEPC